VPYQGRHGRGADQGPQPAREVPAAPWAAVAGRVDLDPPTCQLAGRAAIPRAALAQTHAHYQAVVDARTAELDAIEAELDGWCDRSPFDWQVARLAAYRGVTRLGALSLAAEVCDWRRFGRAAAFMGSVGWSQASIPAATGSTAAGSPRPATPTCARSWSSRPGPTAPAVCWSGDRPRQQGLDPAVIARAWAAQQRLCGRFRTLAARKNTKSIVAAAIARSWPGSCGPR
jgi:transposase